MLRLASRTLGSGLAKSLAVPSVLFRASTRATIPTRSVLASLTSYPTRQSLVSTYTSTFYSTSASPIPSSSEQANLPERFDELTSLRPEIINALTGDFKYENLSPVQRSVCATLASDEDLFVKAKTGTGKTLAFLLPALDTVLRDLGKQGEGAIRSARTPSILIISPTRELAKQIAVEAEKLTRHLRWGVACFVGGESRRNNLSRIRQYRNNIVVATPGRLMDLLGEPEVLESMKSVKVRILDEADTLLEMGFREPIQDILDILSGSRKSKSSLLDTHLSKDAATAHRTLLFSATVSSQIRQVAAFALRPNHTFIDCVDPNERNVPEHIKQRYVVATLDQQPLLVRHIIAQHQRTTPGGGKIIIFCPTTRMTQLYASLFGAMGLRHYELHSRKEQRARERVAKRFREDRGAAVLFTSDVSGRGVDYPGVTLVLNVGLPPSRDQYIHRIGRTGRAGADGQAMTVLADFESGFLR
ncbi:P-loop containing nucleoside triphosphate hydrolase protein, partial [Piptocephalis cylindrospora]